MVKLIQDLVGLVNLVFALVLIRDIICLVLFLEYKRKFKNSWTVGLINILSKATNKGLHKLMKFVLRVFKEKKKQRANLQTVSSVNIEKGKCTKLRSFPDYLRVVK